MSENISNNLKLQREIDSLKKKNKSLEKDLEVSRKINLDSLQENEKLKQALKMVMTQSRIEFDKTATIIGYSRQKQILQEMFEEQREVLSRQLSELILINIPGVRSLTQMTIGLMINRIRYYFNNEEISKIIPQIQEDINTSQVSDKSKKADEIFKQFYPKNNE